MAFNREEIGMSVASAGRLLLVSTFVCVALAPAAASAQSDIIDEVKFGALAHDVTLGGRHVESGADLNGEVLFTSPDFLAAIGAPRPHIGAEVNTDGNTDSAYFGLTWGLPIVQSLFGATDTLTIYGSLGGSVNDGYQDNAPPGRKKLGSPVLFRESVELGYQVTPVNSLSILVDHISNADLARRNAGITNVGARMGFKF
jgi:lipid A 3-O-deacylase